MDQLGFHQKTRFMPNGLNEYMVDKIKVTNNACDAFRY